MCKDHRNAPNLDSWQKLIKTNQPFIELKLPPVEQSVGAGAGT